MRMLKNLGTLGMLVAPVMVISCGCTTASSDGDSTTENANENPVDTNDDEVVEETTELVNKSAEELELDAFEDLWGYRPHQPLAAYPELTGSLADDLRDAFFYHIDNRDNLDWEEELLHFTDDHKQDLYISLDSIDKLTYDGYFSGEIVITIYFSNSSGITNSNGTFTTIYAIYYEIYDMLHDWEVYENETYLTTDTDDWDYLAPYNVY